MVGARYLKHLRRVIHGFYKVKKKGMVPLSMRVTAGTLPFSSGGSPAVCGGPVSFLESHKSAGNEEHD